MKIEINIEKKLMLVLVAAICIISAMPLILATPATGVTHPADDTTPGTFYTGNYTFPNNLIINGSVGIGTVSPSYKLDVNSSLRLIPTATAPAGNNGVIFYNTSSNKFRCYEGGAWKDCINSTGGVSTLSCTERTSSAGNSVVTVSCLAGETVHNCDFNQVSGGCTYTSMTATATSCTFSGLVCAMGCNCGQAEALCCQGGGGGGATTDYECKRTPGTYTGNLGGISGADAICASVFGSGWTFMNTKEEIWAVIRKDPTVYSGLPTGSYGINTSFDQQLENNAWYWEPSEERFGANSNCAEYTSNSGVVYGGVSTISRVGGGGSVWIYSELACSNSYRIWCCNPVSSGGGGGSSVSFTYYCFNNTSNPPFIGGYPECTDAGGSQRYCPAGFRQIYNVGGWGCVCRDYGGNFIPTFFPPGTTCGNPPCIYGIPAQYPNPIGQAYVCSQ
jgi:hypothetical protein